MKINQYISEAKLCSRRETDRLIKAGRVAINGEICTHGALVSDGDRVTIDGQVIVKEEKEKCISHFINQSELLVQQPIILKIILLIISITQSESFQLGD